VGIARVRRLVRSAQGFPVCVEAAEGGRPGFAVLGPDTGRWDIVFTLPPDTSPENIHALMACVHRYGQYRADGSLDERQ
jgi:hypothetical protein